MLPESIELEVVTPARRLLHETVQAVEMPGKEGYLGILPGHAPLITALGIGHLSYRKDAETYYLVVIHGYAEVLPDRVIVLADIAERAEEIDVERAHAARDRARERIAKASPDLDWDRVIFALERAEARLEVAAKVGVTTAAARERHAAP
jgi:F-type H+-transporting ATPase subunit epsilon